MKWEVPFFSPTIGEREFTAVQRPLRNQWLTMGEEVQQVEEYLKKILQVKNVFLVTNCTAALHLAAVALDLKPEDEVICPTLTFVASANVFKAVGSHVIFCESKGNDDLTMDPLDIKRKISPKTRAIVVVHYAGFPCDMIEIKRIARQFSLKIIEDCAHAVFTKSGSSYLGTIGDIGCYSFFSNKNVTCGEGGAVVTNNDHLAERIRLLRSHGMTSLTLDRYQGRASSYDVLMPGFNYRMDEIRAAFLSAQLEQLSLFLEKRRALFIAYKNLLADMPVILPFAGRTEHKDWNDTAVHILPVLLPGNIDRTAVMENMKKHGIQTSIHYPCVHKFTAFVNNGQTLPVTEHISEHIMTLPFYPNMTEAQCKKVVNSLKDSLTIAGER